MAIQDRERERFVQALRRELTADGLSLDGVLALATKMRQDAERYRWLRHGDNDERGAIQRPGPQTFLLRDGLLDICCDAGMADDADESAHTVAAPAVGAA